ncbi:methylated-DNA--protein-cysteine methyltransferase [Zafaria cholistanensis]|uniref:Methylated-DNA--protein-cysteine methyltransferase n=1 Tax=Zafaria cholistanensis TaxID=1682741 RepID=A0A5A7NSQ1_9MICC|nr:methylated-DNA--[protein]-cysteine S-methyltransferase [Zafaria cholistanensis]GER23636.1 methylated-DNA--protein-cysteine methyltransferase [Zafaria cholistanensis]
MRKPFEAAGPAPGLPAGTPASLPASLHAPLEDAAAGAGIPDIAYTTVSTPIGDLLLAATGRGLLRVAFPGEDHDAVLHRLAERAGPRILRSPRRLEEAARQLDEYFTGRRRHFDLPLDRSLSAGFRLTVLEHLSGIGFGRTESYAEVARRVGHARAVRAVGSACATNPLPVVVPCHRVLRTDGSLGGYLGGLAAKTALLELEAAA